MLLCRVVKYRAMSVTCSLPQDQIMQRVQLLPFFVWSFIIYNKHPVYSLQGFPKRFHIVSILKVQISRLVLWKRERRRRHDRQQRCCKIVKDIRCHAVLPESPEQ